MIPLCGRFTLLADGMAIKKRFKIANEIVQIRPRYNIAPGEDVFTVIFDGEKRRGGYIRWGLVPFWAKDDKIGYKMINARSETVHEKTSFKHLLTRKRCLIIADSFYEWQKTDAGRNVHRIHLQDGNLFGFAGLWDKWDKGGQPLFTCTILTKEANEFMRPIHHRMPIIVPNHREEEWLTHPFQHPNEVHAFIQSLEDPHLTSYEVSDYVNRAGNDDPKCIEPLQHGNE